MILIRETDISDIESIYINLNMNFVKKHFKNDEKNQRKKYEDWYKEIIKSNDYIMFTIENGDKNFLGNIKFKLDRKLKKAEITIYLAENIRGNGYSNEILERGIEEIKFKYFELEKIEAYILEENEKSILCFEKLGFRFEEKVIQDGIEYNLYSLYI